MAAGLSASPGAVYTDWVLPFLDEAMAQGQRVALVTLVGVSGSSPRPLGSQLAVREDGASVGLISGGCVEPSLVLDAVQAIRDQRCHLERYGQGSRFIDLRLPCGSAIDVYFDTGLTRDLVKDLLEARAQRRPVTMAIDTSRHRRRLLDDEQMAPDLFLRPYAPSCRITIAGAGHVMVALAGLCRLCEMEVDLVSTDRLTCHLLEQQGFHPQVVNAWAQAGWHGLDRWSGAVLLSHDHDDEAGVLADILGTQAFYIGALGSRRTHARRLDLLRHMGVPEDDLARIRGPVGLSIGAMTPPEIATSILAEIIAHWRARPNSHAGHAAADLARMEA
ncbi:XdhC family protein [Novosphingobium rosa]|uniref:XdhC family protein n=1 Tax=Novosphingobium rosa TaxID=76978 RepID=UPI0008307DB2|nr:XdhC family protein [Novosphingobium rosa]